VTFKLPHLRAALNGSMEGIVVALGSSSTLGIAASDAAHSYPAILQFVLNGLLPHGHIAVLNRGIGGQDAPEELARMDTDVVAIRPHLVIWQIGANGALRGEDPAEFRRLVIEGVHRLHRAGIDVILMDSQRSPKVEAAKSHAVLDAVLADVAKETGAGLFPALPSWTRGQRRDRHCPILWRQTICTTTIAVTPAWHAPSERAS
jgi:lysophospholipase L1-like esterase